MKDPFAELGDTLQTLFRTAVIRNGKYAIHPIQELKDALDQYKPPTHERFIALVKALAHCTPYMNKKFHVLNHALHSTSELAKELNIPQSQWLQVMKEENRSSRFAPTPRPPDEKTLIPWLSHLTGQHFNSLSHSEKTQVLAEHSHKKGFSNKLNEYLKKNPDFLYKLTLESEKNFQKIVGSLLNLYLTDVQLAQGIIAHLPKLQEGATDQEQFFKKMDGMMKNGRSMLSLLRNSDAQALLEPKMNFDEPLSSEIRP